MVGFFIQRPIFASAIAAIMVLAGAICFFLLPVSQFPEITPPQVVVSANYPGASAQVVADTVTTPLEEQINGVEGMTYMSSSSSNDGSSTITVTFNVGYPLNIAAVDVQNRVSQAASSLPAIVNQGGVTIKKQNPNFVLIVNLTSPDRSVDPVTLSNYAYLQIVDQLKRLPGVGDVQMFGERRYSMRVWLDPDKLANLGITAVDVQNAIAEQNVQVAAGKIGQSPAPPGTPFELQVNAAGRLSDPEEFGNIIVRADPSSGAVVRLRDVARVELGALQYSSSAYFGKDPTVVMAIFQMPGSNALDLRAPGQGRRWTSLRSVSRTGSPTRCITTRRASSRPRCTTSSSRSFEALAPRRARRVRLPAELADDDHPDDRHSRLAHRDAGGDAGPRLLAQHAEPARHGAGDRPRRRRRDRRRRERRTPARGRTAAPRRGEEGDGGSDRADHRDDRGADGGVRAGRLHSRRRRAPLQPVRADGRDFGRHFRLQLADPQPGAERGVPASRAERTVRSVPLVQRRL